jgi:hypothetical protein
MRSKKSADYFVSALFTFCFSFLLLVLKPVTMNFNIRLPMFVADRANSSSNFIFAHVGRDSK